MRAITIALASCLLAATSVRAQDDPLGVGDAAYADADIDGANTAYQSALQTGELRPRQVAHVQRRLGILAALLGQSAEAEIAFRHAAALEPDAPVPEDLSPEGRALFTRAIQSTQPLELRVRTEGVGDAGRSAIRLAVEGERAAVRDLEVQLDGTRLLATEAGLFLVPEEHLAPRLNIVALARDMHGNVLAEVTRSLDRVGALAIAEPVEAEPQATSRNRRPLWIGIAVGVALAAGAALAIGLALRDPQARYGPITLEPTE